MLSAKADGTKLKPFICLKGKKTPKDLIDFKTAIICMTENGWMNEGTTKEWIKKVWGALSFGRRLLSWDSFNAHRTKSVKQYLEKLRTDIAMIPGGCTSLPQAPDVCWIKNFKAAYCELYEDWLRTDGIHDKTAAGNPRPPSKLQLCKWVVTAWDSIERSLIVNSFNVCGLTTNSDGSEDNLIHAVKQLDLCDQINQRRKKYHVFDIEDDMFSSSDESVGFDECSDDSFTESNDSE